MRTRITVAGLATLLAATLLTGCGGGSNSADNPYGLIDAGTLSVATSTDQPPFASAAASGKPQGYIIDMTDEIARRLKLKVVYKSTTVPAALSGLTAGQYDLAASGLGVTAERLKSVAFTKALYWSTTSVLTTDKSSQTDLAGFAGKKVGVVTGAVQEDFIKSKMPGAVTAKFPGETQGVSQLLSGNIDAFVVGGPDAESYMKQYPSLKVAVSAPVDHATSMALPKKDTKLVDAMNTQLADMVSDGTFANIYKKWFTEAPLPELTAVWPGLSVSTGSPSATGSAGS